MSFIEDAIDKLLIPDEGGLKSRLEDIQLNFKIPDTEAIAHCYCLKLDGNGNHRMNDLVEHVALRIVDYAIPKKEIENAKAISTAKIISLKQKAQELFTNIKTTGEGGEMLLYILAQDILKLPQLISKMSLKTSGNVHYHGVDGVHVKFDTTTNSLFLYWGESKMYSDIGAALNSCFDSIKGFLLDPYSFSSTQERDLQLISSNLHQNVNDPALEEILVRYFDKDDDLSNNIRYKGICFVGFDNKDYPDKPLSKTMTSLKAEISEHLSDWMDKTKSHISKHANLSKIEMHVFLIPFPSVEAFREHFIKVINA